MNHEIFNLLKSVDSNQSDPKTALEQALQLVDQLKQTGEPVNRRTYELILDAYAKTNDTSQIFELYNQMKAQGLIPRLQFFHQALELAATLHDPILQGKILHYLELSNHKKSAKTYHYMLLCMRETFELERALDTLDMMKKERIKPILSSYINVVDMAIQVQQSHLAFQLLEDIEHLDLFKDYDRSIYLHALRCAAYNSNYDIVKMYWKKVVIDYNLKPDEGLCLYVLNLAGENSNPVLATDVIRYIGENGFRYRECHFTSLIEAFASTNDFKSTFKVLTVMRKVGIKPNKRTVKPIAYKVGQDKNSICIAQDALAHIAAESQEVDVVAFNLIIHALAHNGENDDAFNFYNRAEEFGVTPNDETLDAVLDACIHAKDAELGKLVYRKFISSGRTLATVSNLSKMVTLMCTQSDYEDAFTYLEKMKKLRMIPLQGCYYKLVKTLANANDPRLSLAISDMTAYGYPISNHLNTFIEREENQEQFQIN
ncbi:uncharacterized protein BX663DRAFT_427445 [Cokeromyces recurvatus]|uniref:uncharacterized protein n=1 Tax=Cokeromyces recurvatus TaxID=90255 RepID=UPI00221FCCA7|nr:uncharacterized protein BX663DRAFT_427445 [Cokeromyces recurvatus]KAI7906506.1 hypothetical protein BX663DRAFT_427445 [Cokeromyces recurvatus]